MKREALRHPKMLDLASRLGIDRARAIGIVTLLLDWTADMAPQGDVGKWPDGAIAMACEWGTASGDVSRDATAFVGALVDAGWLDRHPKARLLVHDWPDHCERWVKSKLASLGLDFHPAYADLAPPAEPQETAEAANARDAGRDTGRDISAVPPRARAGACARDQTKPNQPYPNQTKPARSRGKGGTRAGPVGMDSWEQPPPPQPGPKANPLWLLQEHGLDTPTFRPHWLRWCEYLTERNGRAPTRQTLSDHLKRTAAHGEAAAIAAIAEAIANNWQGMLRIEEHAGGGTQAQRAGRGPIQLPTLTDEDLH